MRLVLTIFSIFFYSNILIVNNEEFCSKDKLQCNKDSILVEELRKQQDYQKHVLSQIEAANSNFQICVSTNCSCYLSVLESDLLPFRHGITKEMINKVRSKGTTYILFKGKIYRSKDCMFPARCSGIEHFLRIIKTKVPDVEFVINTRDWPQLNRHFAVEGPVLSFSKTSDYADIMFPAWSFWEGGPAISLYPTGLGRWDRHVKLLSAEAEIWPWEKKLAIGFFRGSRTSEERDPLIMLSRKSPDLVNAQFTKNQAWKSLDDTLGAQPATEVSLEDHCKYKYLFNFRGVAASFRFKHLFLCGSLVIHVGNEWNEFFYSALKPWVHYIPMSAKSNEEDYSNLLLFLKNNDDIAQDIATKGRDFLLEHLKLKHVTCYWKQLVKSYSKLLKFEVQKNKDLIEIV